MNFINRFSIVNKMLVCMLFMVISVCSFSGGFLFDKVYDDFGSVKGYEVSGVRVNKGSEFYIDLINSKNMVVVNYSGVKDTGLTEKSMPFAMQISNDKETKTIKYNKQLKHKIKNDWCFEGLIDYAKFYNFLKLDGVYDVKLINRMTLVELEDVDFRHLEYALDIMEENKVYEKPSVNSKVVMIR